MNNNNYILADIKKEFIKFLNENFENFEKKNFSIRIDKNDNVIKVKCKNRPDTLIIIDLLFDLKFEYDRFIYLK